MEIMLYMMISSATTSAGRDSVPNCIFHINVDFVLSFLDLGTE